MLAARLERWADAERLFEDALALNQRIGHRPEVARTLLGIARLQRDTGRAHDARTLPAQIAQEAEALGMLGLSASARALAAAGTIQADRSGWTARG